MYWEPARPLVAAPSLDVTREPTDLDLDDVMGKRIITTGLSQTVTIREENAVAALEVMSRFAADPRWLVYLPPTMSPTATTDREGLLEHPAEAFAAFRRDGVTRVVCQEKHMGSRAVVVVCRGPDVAERRFGVAESPGGGTIVTRTGRPFFNDQAWEVAVLDKVRAAITRLDLWEELASDWLVLDAELLPWSAKAEELLRRQYASVGAAATATLGADAQLLRGAHDRGADVGDLLARTEERRFMAGRFVDAYRRYCWEVTSVDDLRLAPFQVLAGEGKVHALTDHLWHLDVMGRLAGVDLGAFRATPSVVVDFDDDGSEAAATTCGRSSPAVAARGWSSSPSTWCTEGRRG